MRCSPASQSSTRALASRSSAFWPLPNPSWLEKHDPLGAAAAVLVLAAALRALPVGPPDPLHVVDLEHDQRGAPEEDLRLAHAESLRLAHGGVNGPSGSSARLDW